MKRVRYIGATDEQVRWGSNADPRGILTEGQTYDVEAAIAALPARGVGVVCTWPSCTHAAKGQCQPSTRILAALATTEAPHVNETPKSEHDAGNVLTAAQAREAALKEAAEAWEAFKAANTTTDHFAAVDRLDAILRAMEGRE